MFQATIITILGVRFAKAFSDKFALKTTVSYVEGLDWGANDLRDMNYLDGRYIPGTTTLADSSTFPDYNGVNVMEIKLLILI